VSEIDYPEDFIPIAAGLKRLPNLSPRAGFADRVMSGVSIPQAEGAPTPVVAARPRLDVIRGGVPASLRHVPDAALVRSRRRRLLKVAVAVPTTIGVFVAVSILFAQLDLLGIILSAAAAQLGRFLVFTGDFERAAPHLERALSLAEALYLPETLAQALNSKSVLTMRQHRPREARILVEGALAIALEHDLHAAALRAYNNLGAALWYSDEWREHLTTLDRALELARRIGDRNWEANFLAESISGDTAVGHALAYAHAIERLAG